MSSASGQAHGWPERLGLHRPALRAWALYDVASAAVLDVVVTAVFPVYYATVAAATLAPAVATARFAAVTTGVLAVLGLAAPWLGALADAGQVRRRALAAFVAPGVVAVALLSSVQHGAWRLALALFAIASVGTDGAALFHGALLPHVARGDELDRTSTSACALGYLGAGLVVALALGVIEHPAWFGLPAGAGLPPALETLPARLVFLGVAGWWLAFSVPLLRTPCEPGPGRAPAPRPALAAWAQVAAGLRALRQHPQALRCAGASLLYGTGMSTIVRLAVVYGAEVGLERRSLLLAVVLVDLAGVPFAFAFGALATRLGAKRCILIGLTVYLAVTALAHLMRTAAHFFALALLVASVQGGTQALSRSLFASLVPAWRSGELFGFLALAGRLTAMAGPALFAAVAAAGSSSRGAILSVEVFFACGAALLATVDVEAGRAAAAVGPAPVTSTAPQA